MMNVQLLWYVVFFGWVLWALITAIQDNQRNRK